MSAIEPGTPVRVVIEGVVKHADSVMTTVETSNGARYFAATRNTAVTVKPLDPERPPLEWVIAAHVETSTMGIEQCACDWSSEEVTHVEHLAGELRAAGVAL